MRPFHRFLARLAIAFCLVVLIGTLLQRANTSTNTGTNSEPTGQPAAVSSLESKHA